MIRPCLLRGLWKTRCRVSHIWRSGRVRWMVGRFCSWCGVELVCIRSATSFWESMELVLQNLFQLSVRIRLPAVWVYRLDTVLLLMKFVTWGIRFIHFVQVRYLLVGSFLPVVFLFKLDKCLIGLHLLQRWSNSSYITDYDDGFCGSFAI